MLEKSLAGIHAIALVAALDEALQEHIDINSVQWPKKLKPSLANRIAVVGELVPTLDQARLNGAREVRNRVAHPAGNTSGPKLGWKDVKEIAEAISSALLTLGQLARPPKVEAFFARTPTLYLDELGPRGERVSYAYSVGAKLNGETFIQHQYEVSYLPPAA